VARFTAITGDFGKTVWFTVYQIPLILPMAIPISALITSFQQMEKSELTALRASGLSLRRILAPFLVLSILLAAFNFAICASLTPFCKREGSRLLFEESSDNPLVLLQRQKLMRLSHAWLKLDVESENSVQNLLLITPNRSLNHLNLVAARKLEQQGTTLSGEDVALLSYLPDETLVLENQKQMVTNAPFLSRLLTRSPGRLDEGALNFKMLQLESMGLEMARRISLCLAVVTFTLLGCAFSMEVGRSASRKTLLLAFPLVAAVLLGYFLSKNIKSAQLVLLPHLLVWLVCWRRLYKISKGTLC
jgi:lipopolysaccharide export system permease protein